MQNASKAKVEPCHQKTRKSGETHTSLNLALTRLWFSRFCSEVNQCASSGKISIIVLKSFWLSDSDLCCIITLAEIMDLCPLNHDLKNGFIISSAFLAIESALSDKIVLMPGEILKVPESLEWRDFASVMSRYAE